MITITFHMLEALRKVFDGHVYSADVEHIQIKGRAALVITTYGTSPTGEPFSARYLAVGSTLVTWDPDSSVDVEVHR